MHHSAMSFSFYPPSQKKKKKKKRSWSLCLPCVRLGSAYSVKSGNTGKIMRSHETGELCSDLWECQMHSTGPEETTS